VHAARGAVVVAIDLSGDSLHRRGYRGGQGAAPLKENLAAAVLLRAGWPAIAAIGGAFVDPMCGSGTFAIEAALIAANIAPGLSRKAFGFERWKQHDAGSWQAIRAEAQSQSAPELLTRGRIRGFDRDPVVLRDAVLNAERAGLADRILFQRSELANLPAAPQPAGLIAVNPPYGERIGETEELRSLYALLGERLRAGYRGWEAAVFTGNPPLGRELGINARRTHRMMNGPIECRLLRLSIEPSEFIVAREPGRPPVIDEAGARTRPGAQMFANRLRKNLKALASWARREAVSCYRLYDADMPEYAFAIDLYQSDPQGAGKRWLYVQEYAAPQTVDRDRARARREEAISVLPEVTGLAKDAIYWRTRRPQKARPSTRRSRTRASVSSWRRAA
jgi:23S rRNA (guanine2445-N2)-methyltransferase / 23S rRNA (guanine2069-N7)-methyltransferase